jgi:hypothetical protein
MVSRRGVANPQRSRPRPAWPEVWLRYIGQRESSSGGGRNTDNEFGDRLLPLCREGAMAQISEALRLAGRCSSACRTCGVAVPQLRRRTPSAGSCIGSAAEGSGDTCEAGSAAALGWTHGSAFATLRSRQDPTPLLAGERRQRGGDSASQALRSMTAGKCSREWTVNEGAPGVRQSSSR